MRRAPWWMAAAFAVSVGCGGEATNPNEINFPGAAGAQVAAPEAVPGSGGGASRGGGGGANLPSTYPGNEGVGKVAPEAKPEEAGAPVTKPDAGSAPGTEPKGTPAPAAPDAAAGGGGPQ